MKKWTFLVATLLTLSAGSLMTSCIDNDEPAGIEAIRVATANLLEAKKAVLLAQAESEKVAAENSKLIAAAEAAIKNAQAKREEAEAAYKQAMAAGEQAKADQVKAETEAYIAEAKANLELLIAQNAQKIEEAKVAEEKARYEFEQLKKLNADKLDSDLFNAVVAAYDAYIQQLSAYNTANANLLKAQKKLAESELDLEWNGSSFESPAWDKKATLERNVATAQADVDALNESNAEFEEAIQKLEGIQASELYTLLTDYQAKLKDNKDAQEQIKIALSELCYKNQALYDSVPDLQAQIDALNAEEVAIAPYEYPGNTAIPGFEEKFGIVPDGKTFKLDDLTNYTLYTNAYKRNIEQIKAQLSTPNGSAWTSAELAELERSQVAATKAYEDAQADWNLAKTIYNKDKNCVPDITSADMPQVTEIEAAVTALNGAGAKLQTSKDAVVAAHTAVAKAQKAYTDADKAYTEGSATVAATNAKTTWENAKAAANKAYNDAVKENNKAADAAQAAVDELAKSQELSEKAAKNRVDAAKRQYNLATETALANPTAANVAAQSAALTAWNNAITAQIKLVSDNATAMQKAQEAAQKAQDNASLLNLAAENARRNAIDAADLAFMTAGGNIVDGTYDQAADPAYKPVQEAVTALAAANKTYTEAIKAFNKLVGDTQKKEVKDVTTNLNKQKTELGVAYPLTAWDKFTSDTFVKYTTVPAADDTDANWKKFADDKYNDLSYADLSVFMELNKATGVYTNAKDYVKKTSQVLYGSTVSVDRLEPLTIDEMNEYIAANYPNLAPYQYYTMYSTLFGAYGTVEGNKAQIAAIKATINNADAVNEAVAALETQLKALEDSKTAQGDKVKAVEAQLKAVKDKIAALEGELNTQLGKLTHEASDLNTIIGTVSSAILTINDLNDVGNADEVIKDAIENFENQIKANETPLKNAQERLAKAQFQLNQYENGYTDIENPLKLEVEAAQAELALQKDKLDFLKARLEEAQAKYEANAKA